MGTDRVNLGLHANTDLGIGLFVSKPGGNVMDPAAAIGGNLMFNSSEQDSLNVLQTGNFKITCERESHSISGEKEFLGDPATEDDEFGLGAAKAFELTLLDVVGLPEFTPAHTDGASYHRGAKDKFYWATHYKKLNLGGSVIVPIQPADRHDIENPTADASTQYNRRRAHNYYPLYFETMSDRYTPEQYLNENHPKSGWLQLIKYTDSRAKGTYGDASRGNRPEIGGISGFTAEVSSHAGSPQFIWGGDSFNNPFDGRNYTFGSRNTGLTNFGGYAAYGLGGDYGGTAAEPEWTQNKKIVVKSVDPRNLGFCNKPVVGAMLRTIDTETYTYYQGPGSLNTTWQGIDIPNENLTYNPFESGDALISRWNVNERGVGLYSGNGNKVSSIPTSAVNPTTNYAAEYYPHFHARISKGLAPQVGTDEYTEWVQTAAIRELGVPEDQLFYHSTDRGTDGSSFASDYLNVLFGWEANPNRAKTTSYLDTGMVQIPILKPLPNGEIPEVALRFAVGNSSGHFHPWYANVSLSGSGMDWDEFSYQHSDEIVHMDSPWLRMKWGGTGRQSYTGAPTKFKKDTVDAAISANPTFDWSLIFGESDTTELSKKIQKEETAMQIFSSALGNSEGVVGLINFANSTYITVNAFMTPTHSGLRAIDHSAIDDYANWQFPTPSNIKGPMSHTNAITTTSDATSENIVLFQDLPMSSTYGVRWGTAGNDGYQNRYSAGERDHGHRDLFGWKAHPSQFFVNPFSNSFCTFSTHMLPPYIDYDAVDFPLHYYGRFLPFETEPNNSLLYGGLTWGPDNTTIKSYLNVNNTEAALNTNEELKYSTGTLIQNSPDQRYRFGSGLLNGGIIWPAGHQFADRNDYVQWTGSMGLGGAGTSTALRHNDCWDTFYCSYVVYTHGGSFTSVDTKNPVSVDVVLRATQSVFNFADPTGSYNLTGDMANPTKFRADAENDDVRYFNLNFPDDFVGTIGDSATDPFYNHRDESGKIYGNIHINFIIPEYNTTGADRVYVGSETWEDKVEWANTRVEIPGLFGGPPTVFYAIREKKSTMTPAPAITFDLSSAKFNFVNNKNLSLTIENRGIVLGGGGCGGAGDVVFASGSKVGGGEENFGGGGGGAGGGSGKAHSGSSTENDSRTDYTGTGRGGMAWGRTGGTQTGQTFDGIISSGYFSADERGQNGSDLFFVGESDSRYPMMTAGAGGIAAPYSAQDSSIGSEHPSEGSNGGDCFRIVHDQDILPPIEIINVGSDRSDQTNDAILRSGGGGGGGGRGTAGNYDSGGASGAIAGFNAGASTLDVEENPSLSLPFHHEGGLAGFLVSSLYNNSYNDLDSTPTIKRTENYSEYDLAFPTFPQTFASRGTTWYGTVRAGYKGKVTVINETINSSGGRAKFRKNVIYARGPNDNKENNPYYGSYGFECLQGERKEYK